MAVKHVIEYYEDVCKQREDLIKELKEFEIEAEKGLIEPERLDMIKESLQPLMNNYETLSWIMFLLNKPTRKKKEIGYNKRQRTFTSALDKRFNKEGVLVENNEALSKTRLIMNK